MTSIDPILLASAAATATALAFGATQVLWTTRGPPRPPAARWLAIAAAACTAQATVALLGPIAAPEPLAALLQLVGVANVAAVWAFAMHLLDDGWRWTPLRAGAFVALMASPTVYALSSRGLLPVAWAEAWSPWGAVPAGLAVAHLVLLALRGAADDLVDERRRGRRWLVALIAVGLATVLVGEALGGLGGERLRMGTAALLAFVAMSALARWPRDAWGRAAPAPRPAAPAPSPADALELARLRRLMHEERVYLDPELDLPRLAARVGVPPHRLRRLIRGHLGHRHFADFLNEARLADVKQRLADPALARRPILSVALDAGFASLATFNRVFKAREGLTPTAFRQQALGDARADDPPHSTK